jgi:circadian clock protein KaiC
LIASGVPGLDEVLGGGLRAGHIYFVEGAPGTGKTTLALQFALEGVRRGEATLVISMAECADELCTSAASHGWDLSGLALRDLAAPDAVRSTALFELSEVELDERVDAVLAEMDALRPARLVLDTLGALRDFCTQPWQFRRRLEQFRDKAQALGTTMLFTDDLTGGEQLRPRSLAWGLIQLEQRIGDYGPPRRRLWLPKLRGQPYSGGCHDMRIATGGVQVFPRLETPAPTEPAAGGQVQSGVAELDTLLGGGLERGTSLGILGPPGCGKSTLVCLFALAAVARGERAALYLFDEAEETLKLRCRSQQLDVDAALASGLLALRQLDPAEVAPGELARELHTEVVERGTRIIAIDSLNGYLQAMPDERFMSLHVHHLLSWLGRHRVLSLLTLALPSPLSQKAGLDLDLSYITDAVIAQRYFEAYGSIRYALSVIKKRYGDHERAIREFRIGAGGIIVGAPLAEFRGVLSGVPEYVGERQPLL